MTAAMTVRTVQGPRPERTYRRLVDSDWTSDIRVYIARLGDAQLIPPIGGVEVAEREGGDVLLIEVRVPITDELSDRIGSVLGSVPHVIREALPLEDGRVPGVSYRRISG
jgi:hypothetical protein